MTLDAAVALEQRLSAATGADDNAFIDAAFEHLLSREPSDSERRVSAAFLRQSARETTRRRQHCLGALFNHNDFITLR